MKKKILLLFLSLLTTPVFAYYNSYSDYDSGSGWLTFISIVMLVWGVLEIILFFKIWGMTNNLKELKDRYFEDKQHRDNIVVSYFSIKEMKGTEVAKNFLIDAILKDVFAISENDIYSVEDFQRAIEGCEKKYQYLMDIADIKFPDMTEYIEYVFPMEMDGYKIGDKMQSGYYSAEIVGFNRITSRVKVEGNNGYSESYTIEEMKKYKFKSNERL